LPRLRKGRDKIKTLILAEKPAVAEHMTVALGVPAVAARGHLLELKPVSRRWNPPYFELKWVPKVAAVKLLDDLVDAIREADEVVVGTDYDEEGQLLARNILQHADVEPSSVVRMKFSSLEPEEISKAYNSPIKFDMNIAYAAECRHHLDWYFGQNISKTLTQISGNRTGRRGLTPVGRVQSPTLFHLVKKEREIDGFVPRDVWWAEMYGLDSSTVFRVGSLRFGTKANVENFVKNTQAVAVDRREYVREVEHFAPNADDIIEECLRMGIQADIANRILRDLFQDAFISYPGTESQKYKGVDTRKYLRRIAAAVPLAKEALELGLPPREGPADDPAHPAIYAIKPYPEKKGLYATIWNIVAEKFVQCHLPPEKFIEVETDIQIGEETVRCSGKLPDQFDVRYNVEKRKTRPPSRHGAEDVYSFMREVDIGTKDTRTVTLSKLFGTYVHQTSEGLFVSSKGMRVANCLEHLAGDLVSVDLTRRFEKLVKDVRSRKQSMNEVLKEGKRSVTKLVKKLQDNKEEVARLLSGSGNTKNIEAQLGG